MTNIKKILGGSPKTLNDINISIVLDRIRSSTKVSRTSISKELDLSLPSIVFCKVKFPTFAKLFPQAPVGNFFVN